MNEKQKEFCKLIGSTISSWADLNEITTTTSVHLAEEVLEFCEAQGVDQKTFESLDVNTWLLLHAIKELK